ncbi:MAG: hypothetical protein K6D38_06980 [Pseudobutyrivibrio sp.]|nr:hypothetical protein [Pseudobutyrivibrio sp.]
MKRKTVITFALLMAACTAMISTTTILADAKGFRHCHHHHKTVVENNVDEQTTEETTVETTDDSAKGIMEKCKALTPFEVVTDEDNQQFLLLVETKTGGINVYKEKDIISFEKIDVEGLTEKEAYYDTKITNPQDMELIYSSDGNEDISIVHMVGEFGAFQCVGDRLKAPKYEGMTYDETIKQGPALDQNKQYVNFLFHNFRDGALRGVAESTTSATEVKYETGDMFEGGGYDYYAEYGDNNGADAEYTLGYNIVINKDKTITFTIGAYNEDNNFAADVTYNLVAEDGGAYAILPQLIDNGDGNYTLFQ